jgi:hypothetical protein
MVYFIDIRLMVAFLVLLAVIFLSQIIFFIRRYKKAVSEALEEDVRHFEGYTEEDYEKFEDGIDFTFPQYGPRMDTKNMSRRELFRSGFHFLALGIIPLLTIIILGLLEANSNFISEQIYMAIGFASVIFLLMCILGGGYMVLRGVFRREKPRIAKPL